MPPTLRQYGNKRSRTRKIAPLVELELKHLSLVNTASSICTRTRAVRGEVTSTVGENALQESKSDTKQPKPRAAALRDVDVNKITEPKRRTEKCVALARTDTRGQKCDSIKPEDSGVAVVATVCEALTNRQLKAEESLVKEALQASTKKKRVVSTPQTRSQPQPEPISTRTRTRTNSVANETAPTGTTLVEKTQTTTCKVTDSVLKSKTTVHVKTAPASDTLGVALPFCELTWDQLCPPDSAISKIAEASFAEVYRVRNSLGTSIIKVIRLTSPLKPQTAAQKQAGLVDEEPHDLGSASSELLISQWLASIPGFVVYKEQFHVVGKATPALLAAHRAFHRRIKRQDPDRLQFYPSPARYLADTRFLVVELGDAGTALEDFDVRSVTELWDIFLLLAIALARAEDVAGFEHRDLHEGNVCVKRVREAADEATFLNSLQDSPQRFGFSGLDITVLDYGMSRAEDPSGRASNNDNDSNLYRCGRSSTFRLTRERRIAFADLDADLSLFTSTHAAAQCAVYRRMRTHLLLGPGGNGGNSGNVRAPLLPPSHSIFRRAHPVGPATAGRPLDWGVHAPYTNVLWLAYMYKFLLGLAGKCFSAAGAPAAGDAATTTGDTAISGVRMTAAAERRRRMAALRAFKSETAELWRLLDPDGPEGDTVEVVVHVVDKGDSDGPLEDSDVDVQDEVRVQWAPFTCAGDVVRFAVDMCWVSPDQLLGAPADDYSVLGQLAGEVVATAPAEGDKDGKARGREDKEQEVRELEEPVDVDVEDEDEDEDEGDGKDDETGETDDDEHNRSEDDVVKQSVGRIRRGLSKLAIRQNVTRSHRAKDKILSSSAALKTTRGRGNVVSQC